jgi:phage gpG-like protein
MLTVQIVGTENVVASFRQKAAAVRANVTTAIAAASIDLVAKVKFQYLSGQVLRTRTDKLRSSIHASSVEETPDGLNASVGTNVEYARIHEIGGLLEVRAKIQQRRRAVGLGKRPKKFYPGSWPVRAYSANYTQRAFLAPALDTSRDDIRERLDNAVRKAIGNG